jgi:hypothetical protein
VLWTASLNKTQINSLWISIQYTGGNTYHQILKKDVWYHLFISSLLAYVNYMLLKPHQVSVNQEYLLGCTALKETFQYIHTYIHTKESKKIIRTFVFPSYLHKSRGWTSTSFFYIVTFLFDALGPAVHKLAYSVHEGFRLVAQPFMHRFPPRRLMRIAGFRLLASKSL